MFKNLFWGIAHFPIFEWEVNLEIDIFLVSNFHEPFNVSQIQIMYTGQFYEEKR